MRGSIVASICLAALGLAACGSSSSSRTATAGQSPVVTAPTPAQQRARLDLAKCMRAHGVDVPDSVATGAAGAREGAQQLLQKYSTTQLQNAISACRANLVAAFPQLNLSPAQLAQRRQEVLAFVRCMRSHGVDLPDPTTSGLGLGLARALSSIDTNSPTFKAANAACASLRPLRARGG